MSKPLAQPERRATIRDVARAAGVSVTTVSNLLNGRSAAMTLDTRLRIEAVMDSLGYRRSDVARSLATHRTRSIGVILAEMQTPLFLQSLSYIEPLARSVGYNTLLCNTRAPADEEAAVKLLLEKQVDGIILFSTSRLLDADYLADYAALALPPMVLVNRSTRHERFDQINWDSSQATSATVDHLAGLGHRLIAHVGGPADRHSTGERLAGYQAGLARNGLAFRADYVRQTDYAARPEVWERLTQDLLAASPRPTAIITAGDTVAAHVMRTLQRSGLDVPGDISVVGCDDQPFCTFLNPALTTIRLPVAAASMHAFEMLVERMDGRRIEPQHLTLSCQLVVRESTGPVPGAADAA